MPERREGRCLEGTHMKDITSIWFVSLFAAGLTVGHARAQDDAKRAGGLTQLEPATYTFSRETITHPQETVEEPVYADPKLTKLVDGDKDLAARKNVWRCKGWEGGRVLDIDFAFPQPVELHQVLVHSLRRRGYAVARIQVFGQGDADETLVGDVTFNQSWAYPPEPDMPPTAMTPLTVPCEPSVVRDARIRVHVISYLGLAEIEFFGVADKAPVVPATSAYRLPAAAAESSFRVLTGDFNGDGLQDFLLENGLAAYIVEPRWGGVVNVALNKRTGVNLVKPNAKGTWGGLFADRMYPEGRSDFFSQAYTGAIVTKTPERVAVRVQGSGKSGRFLNITFEKTFSLAPQSIALRADYRVLNGQDNVVAVDYGAWVLNGMGSTREPTRVFWADESGPRELRDLSTQYVYEPRRGWLGMLTESGSGIAMLSEYRRTASFLLWRSGDFATIEFKMGRYPIEAGGHLGMTAWAVPFDGVGTPHGVSAAMVGSFDIASSVPTAPERVEFRLKPSGTGTFRIVVESRQLPGEQWLTQYDTEATMDAVPVSMSAPLKLNGSGAFVLRVRALDEGRGVFAMERPVSVGEVTADYAMAPECERYLPESAEDKNGRIDYHAPDYATAHVPWAKRWAGGKPRVLFLPRRRAGIREAVELAQRFEMECHTSYLPRSMEAGCLYDLSDFAGRLNAPQLLAALKETLTEQTFDAIVIPGDLWKDLRAEMQELILGKVKAGAGLVLLAPEYIPDELTALIELTGPESELHRLRGEWRRGVEHFITDGVPLDALPETLALPYRMDGQVLALIGEHPLTAISEFGAGRVVSASWVVAGLRRAEYDQTYGGVGLLPNMLALGSGFSWDAHYWEYQMSLLMRMVYWAAKKETPVRGGVAIGEVRPDGTGDAVLTLRDASGRDVQVTVQWTLRDRFSRVADEGVVKGTIRGDIETPIPIAFRHAALDGPIYLEAVVLTEGATTWWGTGAGRVAAPTRIEDASLAQRLWRREDVLRGELQLSGALNGVRSIVEGVDSHGRVFARQEGAAREASLSYELPLAGCLGLTGRIVARLVATGQTVSERHLPFVVHHPPEPTRMQVAFGWPWVSPGGQRRFLHEHYYRRLAHLGATSVRVHGVLPFEWFEARSLGLTTLKTRGSTGIGGKRPNQRVDGKGKFGLIRKPCLSAPEYQQNLVAASAQPGAFEDAGTLYRGLGDELNSISNWDGCFSEDCQRLFRSWLRERYGELASLNREWATAYTSWDDVVALTLDEVKGHPSLAPWVEHRLFNNWNWTRSMASILEGIRQTDPDLRLGFSGTQETKPWNAYDWWEICKSVSAVASYSGEQVVQRRSFSRDMVSMSWIGYTASFEQLKMRILSGLFDGDSGFNVFSGRFMVDPDYTIPERGEWLRQALSIVGDGRAEVIMNSEYDAGPIAVHYTPASVCVAQALGTNALRVSETVGMRRLILEQSADYDYIAYAQLEQGEVRSRHGQTYRLLILPASAAMSETECDSVRRWVAAGGVLVGGFGTATYTERGRKRESGGLDEVFGLRRARSHVQSGSVRVVAAGSTYGAEFADFEIPAEHIELGLSAAGAQVLAWALLEGGKHPAVCINRHGSGVAIYLAADVASTYGTWGATGRMASRVEAARGMDRFMASILRLAQAPERPIPLTADGRRLSCTRMVFRRNGPMRLIGVIRDVREAQDLDPKPHDVTLQLGQPYHVYDLVSRAYVGRTDVYRCTFSPSTQCALVLLPYQVGGLELQVVGGPAAQRGERAAIQARVVADTERLAEHRVQVVVVGPDGKRCPGYDEVLVLRDGSGMVELPVALDATPGTWRVTMTDAISNVSATAEFMVAQ